MNDEFDPPLTAEGRDLVEQLGEWMKANDEVPNVIYASPMNRTQETAEILRNAFGLDSVKTDITLQPMASIKGLVQRLASKDSVTRPLIVSHHETIASALRNLDGASEKVDALAQAELRIYKAKRKNGKLEEKKRVLPSDIKTTNVDHY